MGYGDGVWGVNENGQGEQRRCLSTQIHSHLQPYTDSPSNIAVGALHIYTAQS